MRKSLITSLVFHAAILVAALVVLPNPDKFQVQPQDSIQVDISQIGDASKRKATTKAAEKPAEKPVPKKTEVVKAVEPAPKIDEKVKTAVKEPVAAPPPPAPKVEEPKKEEPKPLDSDPLKDLLKKVVEEPKPKEEVKKAEVKPVKKPDEKKPKKKPPKLDLDVIAAELNKTEDEKTAPAPPSDTAGEPEQGAADIQGTDETLAATIGEALVSQVKQCFTVPPAARELDISVRIRFQLNQDGSVAGKPVIENSSSDPVFDATARAAVSAILDCQNYNLPQDHYDLWQENGLDFNPRLIFGT